MGTDAVDGADAGESREVELFSVQSGRTCVRALALDDDSVFWLASPPRTGESIHKGTDVGRVAKLGGAPTLLGKDGRWPKAIAADETRIYYSVEETGGAVLAVDKRGGDPVELAPFPAAGLAVDSAGLYFTANNGMPGGIYVVRPGTTAPAHLAVGPEPSSVEGLALDASFVYWPQGEQLLRAPKAGGPVTILWGTAEGGIGALLVAINSDEIYWHGGDQWIRRGPIGGGQAPTRLARYSLGSLNVANGAVFGIVVEGSNRGGIVRIEGDGSAVAMASSTYPSSILATGVDADTIYFARCKCECARGQPSHACREWDCSTGLFRVPQRW